MSEEINKLKEYLQYRISELKDSKLFYCENDELKIVDAINGIVDLQQKVEQLEKENEKLRDKIVELQGYKEAIYEIKKYIDAYSPYFLETQEQNNQTIAIIIDNIGNLGE